MDSLRRAALLTRLIGDLRENGSWCGETHVQKAAYFAKAVAQVDMGHDFVLYMYGPFSFDLRADLTALRADGMTEFEIEYPYGPRIVTTGQAGYIQGLYPKTVAKYERGLRFAAKKLGRKGVAELERVCTGLFLSRKMGSGAEAEDVADRMTKLKPHITQLEAIDGVREARALEAAARKAFPS